jgi:hypothetical protein
MNEVEQLREMIARELNRDNPPSTENLKSQLLKVAEEGGWLTEDLPDRIDHEIELLGPLIE